MKNKKGTELTISTIVIAIIVLIIIVLVAIILAVKTDFLQRNLSSCESNGGVCKADTVEAKECPGKNFNNYKCPEGNVCCLLN